MTKTFFFRLPTWRLDKILSFTRNTTNVLVFLSLLPFLSGAQDNVSEESVIRPDSRLVFSSTAYFSAGTDLLLRGENPIFADAQRSYETHGRLQVSLLKMVQIDVTNEGTIAGANGGVESLVMWGMKLRVFESENGWTGVAALFRAPVGKGYSDSWPNSMEAVA